TWESALMVARDGRRVAVVGNYDADPLRASGNWHAVVPYVQGIRDALLATLDDLIPKSVAQPRIALNWSEDNDKADGLTVGMLRLLERYVAGTRFEGAFVGAGGILGALRGRKTPAERARIEEAIAHTDRLFEEVATEIAKVGVTERAIQDEIHRRMAARGLGFAWERSGDPIVNCGPDSMIGHGVPSETLALAPGHILHIDLGVVTREYASDLQRCWYVGETVPEVVLRAFDTVHRAISAGAAALRPGTHGWQVDAAARRVVVEAGYSEYLHALGHQVGRVAHDGGGLLGPLWERYGAAPRQPVEVDQIYTLELGIDVPGAGYLGIEEMVVVEPEGCRFLSTRQNHVPTL
ncbi:MAG: M24 family metallopeptidase, partial [Armatimonadota bacterium]